MGAEGRRFKSCRPDHCLLATHRVVFYLQEKVLKSFLKKDEEIKMICDKKITMLNGVEIPVLGLGTWLIPNDKAPIVVKDAIEIGYRHIDTAQAYGNEEGVGLGIQLSKIKREDIFIQTKVAAEIKDYEQAKIEIEKSFKKLKVDYIDLMIIHSPQPWSEFGSPNRYKEENIAVWNALVEYYKEGKIKAIGVSNFSIEDIENILQHSSVKPMVNQILCHISNTDFELIKYCRDHDIIVEAYSPIAHGKLLENEQLKQMADKYGVSTAQLSIQYTLQLGLVSLPKASSHNHLKTNTELNFVISDEDMNQLVKMDKIHDYGEYSSFPVYVMR